MVESLLVTTGRSLPSNTPSKGNYGQLADGPTRRRQLADVKNRVETSASWSSIRYNLLEVNDI